MRERESIFIEYVNDLRKREKEEKSMLKEKVRIEMLLEAVQTLISLSLVMRKKDNFSKDDKHCHDLQYMFLFKNAP